MGISGPELIAAAKDGKIEAVKAGVTADRTLLAYTDKWGLAPIHWAALSGNAGVIECLLEHGDDPNRASDGENDRPIHCAAQKGHTHVVGLLLRCGALINARGGDENTALHTAARDGHLEVVELLLKSGAAVDEKCEDNATPLDLACRKGHEEIVDRLLRAGASATNRNTKGATPLHYAAFQGSKRISSALLERGAQLDVKDLQGHSPLDMARLAGHASLFEGLLRQLEKGAAIDAMKEAALPKSGAYQAMLQAARDLHIIDSDSWQLDPHVMGFCSEIAGALLRDIFTHPTPRGLDFRLIQKAFVYVSYKAFECVLRPGLEVSKVYHSDDFLQGRRSVELDAIQLGNAEDFEQSALRLFDAFQARCVSQAHAGARIDVMQEISDALRAASLIAANAARTTG